MTLSRPLAALPLALLLAACGSGSSDSMPASSDPPSAEADPLSDPNPQPVRTDLRDTQCRSMRAFYNGFFGPPVETIAIDGATLGGINSETLLYRNDLDQLYGIRPEWGPSITGCRAYTA